jgi:hypothetical protein
LDLDGPSLRAVRTAEPDSVTATELPIKAAKGAKK